LQEDNFARSTTSACYWWVNSRDYNASPGKPIETRPPVYLVKDDHGEILEGTFYAEELQKVIKTDDINKIEPILKKRKKGRRCVKYFHILVFNVLLKLSTILALVSSL
jgi:hypothetical protein